MSLTVLSLPGDGIQGHQWLPMSVLDDPSIEEGVETNSATPPLEIYLNAQ